MTIEQNLSSIAESLKIIATVLSSGASAVAVLGAPEASAATSAPVAKTRAKKGDVEGNAPATATPATESVATPAVTTPAASTVSVATPWPDVMGKIVEVNKSTTAGCGRPGVEAILKKFFGDQADGKKVPNLEALGKNEEILAFALSLLNPVAADDDLGL